LVLRSREGKKRSRRMPSHSGGTRNTRKMASSGTCGGRTRGGGEGGLEGRGMTPPRGSGLGSPSDLGAHALIGEDLEEECVALAPVDDVGLFDAPVHGLDRATHLGD